MPPVPPSESPMSPARLKWVLPRLGISERQLARMLGIHDSSVRKMGNGKKNIPHTLADWLERKLAGEAVGELPDGWRANRADPEG